MEIRSVSPSDAEAIAQLIASFQSELTDDPSGAGTGAYLASVSAQAGREYLTSPRYRYVLAYPGLQLAAFIAIRDGSHLFHLFVERAHQRQGLASALWERALHELGRPESQGAFTLDEPMICGIINLSLAIIIGKGNGTRERSSKAKRARKERRDAT